MPEDNRDFALKHFKRGNPEFLEWTPEGTLKLLVAKPASAAHFFEEEISITELFAVSLRGARPMEQTKKIEDNKLYLVFSGDGAVNMALALRDELHIKFKGSDNIPGGKTVAAAPEPGKESTDPFAALTVALNRKFGELAPTVLRMSEGKVVLAVDPTFSRILLAEIGIKITGIERGPYILGTLSRPEVRVPIENLPDNLKPGAAIPPSLPGQTGSDAPPYRSGQTR